MKKLLSLLMILTFAGVGNVWAQESYSLVQDNTIAFTPGTADNTSVENLTFTIGANETWTTQSRTYNSYTKSAKKGSVSLTNNVPTAGTFLKFTPSQNGKISVDIYWDGTNKEIRAYDAANPSVPIASKSVGSTKEAQTFTFDVEADKTYYVYAAGTKALEIFGFTYTPDTERANAVMIAVEDMRYAAQKTGTDLTRTIRDFDFTYSGDIRSYESDGNYTLLVKNNGKITITSKDENIKIQQVALYSTDVSTNNRGDFIYESRTEGNVTVKYLHYTNATGTNSVTFTNGTNDDFNIYNIWIQTDNAISRTKQDVTLSYSPSVGNATVGTNDFSIGELATTPSSFRVDTYTVTDDGGTGTTFNTYHGSTNQASVNVGSKNGVATIQATFAGNDYFNAATPAEYQLVVTGEAKTKWDFTVSEDIDKSNLKADNTNWTYNETNKCYDSNGHDPSGTALTANSVPLLYADGLTFSGNIQIYPDNCIRLTNIGRTITIPNVAANKYVAVTFRSTNTTNSRGFTASGTSDASGEFNTVAQKTVYVKTTSTGSFVLTSNDGIEVLGLEIVNEIPHEAMFTMTTPATTTDVSTSTDIVLTADRGVEVIGGSSTVNLTVNGKTVAFTFNSTNNTLTCSNATLTTAIGGTLADETSYTIALPEDVIQVEGGAQNSAQNFAFVTAAPEAALTPEYNRTWTFDEFETTSFTSDVLENNMELVGKTGSDMVITTSKKTYKDVQYTHRLQTKGTGASDARYIHIKVAAGSKIAVWGVSSNSSEPRTVKITTGSFNGTQVASGTFGSDITTVQTASSIAAESDVYIYATDGAINIYGVKVWSDKTPLTRFSPKGNQYTALDKVGRTEWPPYYIYYSPAEASITAEQLSISSSDASILDVSQVTYDLSTAGQIAISKMKMGEGGTATITLNYLGNDTYAATSTDFTLTVIAPGQFRVQVDDQQIQRGQRSVVTPVITDKNGNPIGIRGTEGNYSTYVLDEDDDTPNYSTYFDFAYSEGEGSGTNYTQIKVDASGNITTRTGDTYAEVGATRTINVTATVRSGYTSLFTNSSISSSGTMTIVEAAQQLEVNFFFDAACTDAHNIVIGRDNRVDGSTGVFGDSGTFPDGFPNGRMIYVKPTNEGDEVWFSFAKNADAATLTSDHKIDKNKRIFQYRRGIPIYINETIQDGDYISVNAVAMYKNESGKWQLRGGVAKMKFLMTDFTRPAKPTYDPVSPDADSDKNHEGKKIMNTSENVVAYGEGASKTTKGDGNLVYGKFSTSSVYKLEQLINEQTVSYGINSVPVVSTEVNMRRFTAVQIKTIDNDANYGYGEYISDTTYTEYFYLYDTRLALTPAGNQYINVNTSTTTPTTSVKWYNKVAPGWQDVNEKTVTFSISSRNDAEGATIDSSTGVVTAVGNAGWVRVKASYAGSYYPGGETHGGSDADGEPQYQSYLAPSEAYFYVYISDPTKEEPMITPPSRKFTSTQSFKIQAPTNWDVLYTTDGKAPTAETGTYLKHGAYIEGVVTETTTIRAIAYNPNAVETTSREVSETYTKVNPLPDPVFDPNGVPSPWYYNTNSLTVQIACAYAGSVIYYTVDGSIPDIDAEGTYKYSGLEKVVIAGNVAIKAIAYDPVEDIYSNVVTSNYIYSSEMQKPYFIVSNDNGSTWFGYNDSGTWAQWTEGGTTANAWNNGQSYQVTPSTQIRIVDPNPVKGNVYFTLDGSVPSANTSLIYRTPFTTPKTVTGKAITFLDEASSKVASAEFVIDSSTYPVWEATYETLTDESGVYGMRKADGYIISTNKNLVTSNSMTKVNTHSISTNNGGTATRTYAQQHITATFGGYDLQDWTQMSIADEAIGNPLGNVGDFTIKSVDNAKDELTNNCNHAYFFRTDGKTAEKTPTLHEKTFKVPANGTFVRFEPERDGDLTIWVLQQGALLYEDDKYFIPNVLRIRPVYLVDEQGKSYQVKTVNGVPQLWSSDRLSENWTKIQATAAVGNWMDSHLNTAGTDMEDDEAYAQYLRYSDGALFPDRPGDYNETSYKRMLNKGPNRTETTAIYNLYKADLDKNHVNVGDPIKPFALHTGSNLSLNAGMYVDNSDDGTGYVLASGGYAKYTFEVKAGKTYYFFAQGSKIGIRGFQFVADTTEPSTLTITESGTSNSTAIATAVDAGTTYKTTGFDRELTANTWTTLVLPFSISATQLEQILGKGTDIMHFDRVEGTRLYFYGHWHRMIVAGTPVFIKPTNTNNPKLNDLYVQVENEVPETFTSGNYTFQGYYDYGQHLNKYDYYISKAGNFCHWTDAATNLKSTRAVLHNDNGASGAKLMLFMEALDEIGETTGIEAIYDTETGETTVVKDATIYNVSGQVVRSHANSLDGLPKGIYIVNGKKYVVE